MADLAPRLYSVTAAQLVNEPTRIAAWARLVAEEADIYRQSGHPEEALAREHRALELALEAWIRDPNAPVQDILQELAPHCDVERLVERHRGALQAYVHTAPDPPTGGASRRA